MINENNSYNNFSHSVKDMKKKKVSSLSNNNINKNKYSNQENIQIKKTINNEIKIMKKINIKHINQKKKNEPLKNNKTKYRFNNNKNYPIDVYGTIGNINSKINKNNQKTNIIKINNKNVEQTLKSKNYPKKAIQEIEMPFTNQKKKYYCVYENNINKIKSNDNQPNISLNKNINTINYDLIDESLNREAFLMNSQNLGNTNNTIISNQNRIFNLKKQNINGANNILLNAKNMKTNMIYSPKRGISHVYSQEKVKSKEKNHINTATDIRIYKNNSVKKLKDFTYNRKNISYKTRNDLINENSLLDNISSNLLKKNFFSNIDNCNLMTNKKDNNDLDECQYNIKPEIYPEIKINLRYGKKGKIRNKSVIDEGNKRYNFDNNDNHYINQNQFVQQNTSFPKNSNYSINENTTNSIRNTINNTKSIYNNPIIRSKSKIKIYKSVEGLNPNFSSISNINTENELSSSRFYKNDNNNNKQILSAKDIYYFLILEEKIKDLSDSLILKKSEAMRNNCFEIINFIYTFNINKYIHTAVSDIMEINDINFFNNYNFFAIIMLYDLTFNEKIFKNVILLIKEIIKLIYANIILIIDHTKKIINYGKINSILNYIIDNMKKKYTQNKELYIEDNEYLLIDQSTYASCEEKITYNLNFIIRNIHTIINNMKNTKNYSNLMYLFKKIGNININNDIEEINEFFRNKILKINVVNSSLLCTEILKNNSQKFTSKINSPYITIPSKKKYSLVISLDDTLVHLKEGSVKNNKGTVLLRPGLSDFFTAIKPYYEIIVFNCGNKQYGDLIINTFDNKNKFIDYRLNRDHCIIINNDYVKDISKIGRSINKIVIVDNLPQNYRLHKENGIYIKSFYGDNPHDKILSYLSKTLINIAKYGGDIKDGIKQYWNEIINKNSSNIYNNYYYK
jgi:Dullard-like phosphatase family protein